MFQLLGWIGTFSYLLAYILLSLRKIKSNGILYHALNIIGAIGLIFNAVHLNDYPNVVVNLAWIFIAIIAVYIIIFQKEV